MGDIMIYMIHHVTHSGFLVLMLFFFYNYIIPSGLLYNISFIYRSEHASLNP
jgi:hypothetical protein